jgi:monomeric phenylalanine-4-hydroxylase
MNTVQDYTIYNDLDQETWAALNRRHSGLDSECISAEYLVGLSRLELDTEKIIKIEDVSKMLEFISGWTLVPVKGLIPTKDFFSMLISKRYPVNINIRKMHELDFSEEPDIFHDVCGHLPLLTNERFVRFLTAYSNIAMKYLNNERAVEYLGRLYWFTYEMGVIREDGVFRAYGGALITSAEELSNVYNNSIPKHAFDLNRIFMTPYDPYKIQKEYFFIESFDDLFESLSVLEHKLAEHLTAPARDFVIRDYSLNRYLGRGFTNVIGFLNDIQSEFPGAVSFVAGQPDESFFDLESHLSKFQVFVNHLVQKTGESRSAVLGSIGQYSKTKGIANDIFARYLKKDENIEVGGEDILITAGAQEAFAIIISTVCDRERDVILVEDPSYMGLSSFAKVYNYNIESVRVDEEGLDLKMLKDKIVEVHRSGKRVKLLYLIPDYQNPFGSCMPVGNRLRILELAQQYNFLVIEDSVYNRFTEYSSRSPALKSLDRYRRVIFVGSFSKVLFPGLRMGFIVADQKIETERNGACSLIDEMVKVKAQLANNTSTINQAIVGGVLLANNFSLEDLCKPKVDRCSQKREYMLNALARHLGESQAAWIENISWNLPRGGFFIRLSVPFYVDFREAHECARNFNVIFCPMRYFYKDGGGKNEIRLAFTNLSEEEIDYGIRQLSLYLKFKIGGIQPVTASPYECNSKF